MADPDISGPGRQRLVRLLPLAAIVLVAVGAYVAFGDSVSFEMLRANREALLAVRDQHYGLMLAGFVVFYVCVVVFSLPFAAVTSVTGGFLFGLVVGSLANALAATIGACLLFLAVRWGLGDALVRRIESSDGKVRRIRTALVENEISVLLLLRLLPVVPFFVANLLPALVGVRFRSFAWTTAAGILPGCVVFTSIGTGLGGVFDRGEAPDLSVLWSVQVLGPILALAGLSAMPLVIRAIRGRKEI
ncbi:TVP38/TMEM64 family protein [Chachezhania sediminis]|uniref:TVP38/TMEM64 family protein n=1 Tax=Chachezhania sediminis TaxID=2599291 RepID=UPI00131CC113|nr:VTT domain-containing protein [Chachezhania sediminis]